MELTEEDRKEIQEYFKKHPDIKQQFIELFEIKDEKETEGKKKVQDSGIDMRRIYEIESSNNPEAYNETSKAVGLGQITPVTLKEWNQFHKNEQLTEEDLYDPNTNMRVASWYMNVRIPQILKAYDIEDSIENRLISYNAGWTYAKDGKELPKETKDYIKKYKG